MMISAKKLLCPAAALIFVLFASPVLKAQPWITEDERLLRGDVIISIHEVTDGQVREIRGEVLFDASQDLIWSVLVDYPSYSKIFSEVTSSDLVDRSGASARVKVHINNMWPYPDFGYTLVFMEDMPSWTLKWTMEEGNLKSLYGSCRLEKFGDDGKMIKAIYTYARDPGWFVPAFSADLENRSIVIERLLGLRKEVRARKKQAEDNGTANEIKPTWKKALFWWEKDEEGEPKKDEPADKKEEKTNKQDKK